MYKESRQENYLFLMFQENKGMIIRMWSITGPRSITSPLMLHVVKLGLTGVYFFSFKH